MVSYWWGKVNQHVDPVTHKWVTDPDGVSGANLDMLTYCQKWYPNTVSVIQYGNQTITTWHDAGNLNDYTSTRMAYQCMPNLSVSRTILPPTPPVLTLATDPGTSPVSCSSNSIVGDVNNDGKVNSLDSLLITRIASGSVSAPVNICCADVNNDKIINSTDATMANYYFISLPPYGYAGQPCSSIPTPITKYTLTYIAGANGSISGNTSQNVTSGLDGTQVAAIANSGYVFSSWSDGLNANPRTDTNVTSNISVTANFLPNTANDCSGPSIKISSPNGGEVYIAGKQIEIDWKSCNIIGALVQISLVTPFQGGFSSYVLADNYSNSGKGTFYLPTSTPVWGHMIYGKNFKIHVNLVGNGTVSEDYSDDFFTINAPTQTSLFGDVNGDKKVDCTDTDMISKAFVQLITLTPDQILRADVNTDGKVNPEDALLITRKNGFTCPASAPANTFMDGCNSNSGISTTTGLACSSGSNLISYWSGKVNQHTDPVTNVWKTDPNGLSGATTPMLNYCKKWWPNTTSVVPFVNQTLNNWHDKYNRNSYTSTRMAYQCVSENSKVTLTPSFIPSASTSSQYIASGPNGLKDGTKAEFKFISTNGNVVISELKFKTLFNDAVTTVRVGNTTAVVVGGVADLTGLNIVVPNDPNGIIVDVYMSYPPVGTGGIAPTTTTAESLIYAKYISNTTSNELSTNIQTPTMMLVSSKPLLSVSTTTNLGLNLGLNKVIDLNVTANNGDISLNNLQFNSLISSSGSNLVFSNPELYDGSNVISKTSCTGTSIITCTMNGYVVPSGTSKIISLYGNIIGSLGNMTSITTTLGDPSVFSWNDAVGVTLTGVNNTTYLYNYPKGSVSVHN